jgi:copper(I)-binding protein
MVDFALLRATALLILTAFFGAAPFAAMAHSAKSGDIEIGHLWAYPTSANGAAKGSYGVAPGGTAIDVYGPFLNTGTANDALIGITSPAASNAHLIMWVRGMQFTGDLSLGLPPGKPVALNPNTQFIRFLTAHQSFKAGDRFPVTLHFFHAPEVTMDVVVQNSAGGQ